MVAPPDDDWDWFDLPPHTAHRNQETVDGLQSEGSAQSAKEKTGLQVSEARNSSNASDGFDTE